MTLDQLGRNAARWTDGSAGRATVAVQGSAFDGQGGRCDVRAMTARTGDLPVGSGWAFEVVWDGLRALVDIHDEQVRVWAGDGADLTSALPEAGLLGRGVSDALLDGEFLATDGTPIDPADPDRGEPVFLVADLLRLYGVDLTERPFQERRRSLEQLAKAHPEWTLPPAFDDAAATLAAADQHRLGGVVAKRLASIYRPGHTSADWVLYRIPETGREHG